VRFVGSVRIPPTAGGRLTVRLKLPAGAGNFHLLLITGQASPRGTPSSQHAVAPGETVLEGPISF
jgi:hypothetical protein